MERIVPRPRLRAVVAALAALLTVGLTFAQNLPFPLEEGEGEFATREVVSGLEMPWEIAWGPDDRLWVTEREAGRVIRVDPQDGTITEALVIDDVLVGPQHEGLLGMALHPELLQGTGNDFVYLVYTYDDDPGEAVMRRARLVRYTYDEATEQLGEPQVLLEGVPAGDDHNGGRLAIGPDMKLYYTIGELGGNQFANFRNPIEAQRLPTADEVAAEDWSAYVGKVLRVNLDGSIPDDNPEIDGVRSHVYTYGHRNPQGLAFGPDGTLYQAEHGPKSDDEVNVLQPGGNYGWPHIAGYQDDMAYVYANWSEAPEGVEYSDFVIPEGVPVQAESEWEVTDHVEPIQTFFTVPDDYEFENTPCGDIGFICWPTIAPSNLAYYDADAIPGWQGSLLVVSLKHGRVYQLQLSDDGRSVDGDPVYYFESVNRYRDLAFSPDGTTVYVITDSRNFTAADEGGLTDELANPGAILEFTYQGDGADGGTEGDTQGD
ncbi:MAG: quinoprotein glucose dehydrogenase [Deinococcales bacterium]|nr:quinoprotein glucose dehydrogenase [Deinococcales bacterium]